MDRLEVEKFIDLDIAQEVKSAFVFFDEGHTKSHAIELTKIYFTAKYMPVDDEEEELEEVPDAHPHA